MASNGQDLFIGTPLAANQAGNNPPDNSQTAQSQVNDSQADIKQNIQQNNQDNRNQDATRPSSPVPNLTLKIPHTSSDSANSQTFKAQSAEPTNPTTPADPPSHQATSSPEVSTAPVAAGQQPPAANQGRPRSFEQASPTAVDHQTISQTASQTTNQTADRVTNQTVNQAANQGTSQENTYSPNEQVPSPSTEQDIGSEAQTNIPDQMGWQQQAPLQPQPEYLLLEWEADSRVSQKRSKEYYSSLAVIVLLVSLILFFAGQTLLIFVVLSFLFISYVLASIKAERVVHQITTYGVRYQAERLYYWEQLGRFWLRSNHGFVEIHIESPNTFGNELILLAPQSQNPEDVNLQDIIDVFSRYLVYEEPIPSRIDRWVMWLQEKFPLE